MSNTQGNSAPKEHKSRVVTISACKIDVSQRVHLDYVNPFRIKDSLRD
jgi:hypothetical protein